MTKNKINTLLENLLSDLYDSKNFKVTCHSFRASIPTLLASMKGDVNASNVQVWGRWDSETYTLYTKNVKAERKSIFDKVVCALEIIWK